MIAPYSNLLLLVLILCCSPIAGQQKIIPVSPEAIAPVGNVYYLSETSDGYLGLSGDHGFSFFDGALTETLVPSEGITFDQPPQSPFFEAPEGSLWFSTYNALYKFNRTTGEVREFQFSRNGAEITAHYRAFHLSSDGEQLYLRAGDRIWSFDLQDETYHEVAGPVNSVNLAINSSENIIVGATWNSDTVQVFSSGKAGSPFTAKSYATGFGQALMATFAKSDSIAYLGTTRGLVELQFNAGKLETRIIEETPRTITSLIPSRDSSCIWFFVREQGLNYYSPRENAVIQRWAPETGLGGQEANAMFQGKNGLLWVAYSNGALDYLTNVENEFTTTFKAGNDKITGLIATDDGEIIIGLHSGKLVSSTKEALPAFTFLPHQGERGARLYYGNDVVFQLGFRNLSVRENNRWKNFSRQESMVREFFYGTSEKHLALNLFGVEEFTVLEDTLLIRPAAGFPVADNLDFVKILSLSDSSFLLSYQTKELWHCELNNGQYKILDKYPLEGPVLSAVLLPDNSIYIGTPTGLFVLSDNRFIPCTPPSSFPKQILSINALTYDNAGNIWCGTPRGLICYRPDIKRFNYFDEVDGLVSSNFLSVRALRFEPEDIWMATDSGLVSFNPRKLLGHTQTASPYIAGIWVNDLPLSNQGILQEALPLSEPFARNSLSFRLANIASTPSAFSAIEYQLEDYDLNVISVRPNSTIRYPNLPPGNYTLQLTAINRNGLPSGKKSLAITIRPPFHQTLTFYLLCTCVLALFAASLYFLGLRRERLKQQRLQEQQARLAAERDRIAGEVHDDLGGQISSILYLSEEMLLTGDTPGYEYELSRINELSRSSLQNVRDIIFALDNRRASLSALGEQLTGAGETFFADRKIGFRTSEEYARPDFELTSRQKRNLTLIVKEAWHNIAKHARATVVTLGLQQADQQLIITVTDNGVGFTSADSASSMGGYGLDNMQEKATAIGGQLAIDSTPGDGTTLRITWPLPTNQ